jgi:Ras association (RalGDS/AF-6) domain
MATPPTTTTTQPTILVRVYFNDMSFKTFAVTDDTTTGELCHMFAKKMRLKGTTIRHFSLNVIVDGQRM